MSTFDEEIPKAFQRRVEERGCSLAQVVELAAKLRAYKAQHLAPGSHRTTPYENLLTLLSSEPLADFMIDHPDEILAHVTRLRELTGFGAHNTFFTLSLPHMASSFSRDPQLFLELATVAGGESIGAFPALKGEQMSQLFARDPHAYLAFVRRVVELLGVRGGSALNALYNDPLARCLGEDADRYVEILGVMKVIDGESWDSLFQFCFSKQPFRDAFVDFFDRKLSEASFTERVRAERPAMPAVKQRTARATKRKPKTPRPS